MTANTAGAADPIQELMGHRYPASDDPTLAESDMVMKGGITSGVVYPLATCELAKRYRFRNLGGSSAGGIAAAFAAVAETNRDGKGFNVLAGLPRELGSQLEWLFQPSNGTRPLHRVLLAFIHPDRKGLQKYGLAYLTALVAAWPGALAGTLAIGVPWLWSLLLTGGTPHSGSDWFDVLRGGWIGLVLSLLVGGSLGALVWLALGGLRGVTENGYGLCRGSAGRAWPANRPASTSRSSTEPFTDWMHDALCRIAEAPRARVLTVGDLWGAEARHRYDDARDAGRDIGEAVTAANPDVRLEMMTTNVTHCRPARLPFENELYLFCREELAGYFPPPVVDHIVASGRAALDERNGDEPWRCPLHPGVELLHVPEPPEFPVVMTVRMTLSFPGLISAVPLYAVDYSLASPKPVRCWFSDGGVSSNFPIHFFDSLWPRRPTFGISLSPYHDEHQESDVYLPAPGRARVARVRPTESLGGFVAALLDTLQNWSDEGQSMLPGYRDRIVDIHHTDDEGGMNLSMSEDTIKKLSLRGLAAARELLDNFDFETHRWIRYRTAMGQLDRSMHDLAARYDADLPGGLHGYRMFVSTYGPTARNYKERRSWVPAAVKRTDALLSFAGRGEDGVVAGVDPDFTPGSPNPRPELRTTPRF